MNFTFEHLESRLLLAAKVNNRNDTLNIRGDGDDDIEIVGVDVNRVEVFIDGTSFGEFANIEDIKIRTGGGDDLVVIDGVVLSDINVSLGGGDDEFELLDSNVGNVTVKTGGGEDFVTLDGNDAIREQTKINTGGGIDDITLDANRMQDNVDIEAGGGDDFITLADNNFAQRIKLDAGGGDDFVDDDGNIVGDETDYNGGGGREDELVSDRPGVLAAAKGFEVLS